MSHDLFLAAKSAMSLAHVPYSNFPVGAAIRTDDGRVFAGANIENISFPEGWCAETTALSHYVMAGGGRITDVAVIAERMDKVMPCGGCRQRLAEFAATDARLHLCGADGVLETVTLGDILPRGFKTEALG